MLRNTQNQIIVLNAAQRNICDIGLKDLANGHNTPEVTARRRILAPLKETLELRDPCGRGTGGMFSIEQRCKVITYSAPANTGKKISNRRRIALHW